MGQGKSPWYTHRLMHWKRVTSELHDSYFCLMMIKHSIPKIEWATEWTIELLYNLVKTGSEGVGDPRSQRQDVVEKATPGQRGPRDPQLSWRSDELETRCDRESHTWPKGPSGPAVVSETRWWQDVVEKVSTQQKAEPLGLRLSIRRTRTTSRLCPEGRVWSIYCSLCSGSNSLSQ